MQDSFRFLLFQWHPWFDESSSLCLQWIRILFYICLCLCHWPALSSYNHLHNFQWNSVPTQSCLFFSELIYCIFLYDWWFYLCPHPRNIYIFISSYNQKLISDYTTTILFCVCVCVGLQDCNFLSCWFNFHMLTKYPDGVY